MQLKQTYNKKHHWRLKQPDCLEWEGKCREALLSVAVTWSRSSGAVVCDAEHRAAFILGMPFLFEGKSNRKTVWWYRLDDLRDIFSKMNERSLSLQGKQLTVFIANDKNLSSENSIFWLETCFFFFLLSRAILTAYEGQGSNRSYSYTIATTWDPSCVWSLHHSSWQCWIVNLLSKAKDGTHNLTVTSQIRFPLCTMETLVNLFLPL